MRISDWSSDVCSSDLVVATAGVVSDKRGGSYVQGRYEIFAAGEVLAQSFDARLSSDNEGVPDSLRMRLYRTDPAGRLLGPLKATHYEYGTASCEERVCQYV